MNSKPPIASPPASDSESSVAASASTRCGYIALVSRPNAGKSTLFNAFIGQHLSIVTSRPQTTRSRILGILTRPHSQIIFVDTPGLLEPRYKLHETMEHQIALAAREADLVLLLIDAGRPRDKHELVSEFLRRVKVPVIAALNKIDLLPPERLEAELSTWKTRFELETLLPLSALRGDHVEELLDQVEKFLPYGEKLYPDDMIAEQPERFFVAELIREAAFNHLAQELPYAINVVIEEFTERQSKTYIQALIYVERATQKGIVIGHKGSRLRTIGRQARLQIEDFLEVPVYLDLWVKIRPDWRKKDKDLKEFGYK